MRKTCSLEDRNSFAPNAISSIDEIRRGKHYFIIFSNRIYKIRILDVIFSNIEDYRPIDIKIRYEYNLPDNYKPIDERFASDMGVVEYYRGGNMWNSINLMFHTLEEAIAFAQNERFPIQSKNMKSVLEYVQHLIATGNSQLSLERNPNFES